MTTVLPTTTTPAAPTTPGPRGRRISLLDRSWSRHWSGVVITPVEMPSLDLIRALLMRLVSEHPTAPLASRIDARARRWLTVPIGERSAHVDEMVTPGTDPDPDDLDAHLRRHLPSLDSPLPVTITVGPTSLCLFINHLIGDAAVLSQLGVGLIRADYESLVRLNVDRADTRTAVRAFTGQLRGHYRDWLRYGLASAPAGEVPAAPALTTPGAAATPQPCFTGRSISNAQLKDLVRWRNQHVPGTSTTALLTVATYLALRAHGIAVDGSGYNALIDTRRYLPEGPGVIPGNLAKALYLTADLTDPIQVAQSMHDAVSSARSVPALLLGAMSSARRHARAAAGAGRGPLRLTFNSMPTLPAISDTPWLSDGARRFYGVGYPGHPDGIDVFALKLRQHMEMTISFDASTAPVEAVHRALDALSDPAALLSARAIDHGAAAALD